MKKWKYFAISLICLNLCLLFAGTDPSYAQTKVDLSGNLLLRYEKKIDKTKLYDNIKFEDEEGNEVPVLLTAISDREVVVVPFFDMAEVKLRLVKGAENCKIEKYTKQAYVGTKENMEKLSSFSAYPVPYPRMLNSLGAVEESKEAAVVRDGAEKPTSGDFSQTNVQVEGIDEADKVKTDGKYIYYMKEDRIVLVEANKGKMKKVSEIPYKRKTYHPRAIYLDGDRLVVVGSSYGSQQATTLTKIYDIKDRTNPKMVRELKQPGSYFDSRKKASELYVLTTDYLYAAPEKTLGYRDSIVSQNDHIIDPKEIMIFPGCASSSLIFISGTDLGRNDQMNMTSFVGEQQNIYMSKDNLYLSYEKRRYHPLFEKPEMRDSIDFRIQYYPIRDEKTNIRKFSVKGTQIRYQAETTIEGWVLNQFSMDEKDGYFRVAFTTDRRNYEKGSSLFVFDSNMKKVGQIANIAPKEKIHSVRFMGDRAYMVTFKDIDPFFVLDLKKPTQPKILGYLKIPGVSEYLHPYDENTVIGFGKDTMNNAKNTAFYLGMKMSLFDVTDVSKPIEKDLVVIGDRGTESELLYDHRVLMYDAKRGLMGFPISIAQVKKEDKMNTQFDFPQYGEEVFQGAYICKVSRDRIEEKGKITHFENYNPYHHDYNDRITRLIYIGDTIYTFSNNKILATDIKTMKTTGSLFVGDKETDK